MKIKILPHHSIINIVSQPIASSLRRQVDSNQIFPNGNTTTDIMLPYPLAGNIIWLAQNC